jgi:hypothetical protein
MIDMSTITKAVETALNANATLISVAAKIDRSKVINADPGNCPWIGVYPGPNVSAVPKTLGSGNARWNNLVDVTVIIQTSTFNLDGQAASDQAELLAQEVLAAINADLTVATAGARVVAADRKYMYVIDDSREDGSLFMPQINITLKMEVRSS